MIYSQSSLSTLYETLIFFFTYFSWCDSRHYILTFPPNSLWLKNFLSQQMISKSLLFIGNNWRPKMASITWNRGKLLLEEKKGKLLFVGKRLGRWAWSKNGSQNLVSKDGYLCLIMGWTPPKIYGKKVLLKTVFYQEIINHITIFK